MSFVEGPSYPPLTTHTLPEFFVNEVLRKHSTRPALICPSEAPGSHGGPLSRNFGIGKHLAWDFAELDRHVQALTRGLINIGVQKGDRVGVIMGNAR